MTDDIDSDLDELQDPEFANHMRAVRRRDRIAEASRIHLRAVWGDDYDNNLELARRGFNGEHVPDVLKQTIKQRLGVKTLTDKDVEHALQSDAALAQMCHAFGKLTAKPIPPAPEPVVPEPKAAPVEIVVPYHKTRPELYRHGDRFAGERAWYEECAGYSYDKKMWLK